MARKSATGSNSPRASRQGASLAKKALKVMLKLGKDWPIEPTDAEAVNAIGLMFDKEQEKRAAKDAAKDDPGFTC